MPTQSTPHPASPAAASAAVQPPGLVEPAVRQMRRYDPPHRTPQAPAIPQRPSPEDVERFLRSIVNPEAQLPDVAKVIETSQGLQAAVLQAANSAEFGLVRPIVQISHAVALLGLRRLQSLARTWSDAMLPKPPTQPT